MVRSYSDWIKNIQEQAKDDDISEEMIILRTFYGVVEQYDDSKSSKAAECALHNAMNCVKKYLEKNN